MLLRHAVVLAATQLLGDISYPIYSTQEITFRPQTANPALLGRVNAAMQIAFKKMWRIGVLASALVLYFSPLRQASCN